MKPITALHILSIAVLMICLSFILVSCKDPEPHVHNWGEWELVADKIPTCVESGKEIRVCADDPSHTETRNVDPDKDAHNWGEWKLAAGKNPTCIESGEEIRVCANDPSHTETRNVNPDEDAHVFEGQEYLSSPEGHWRSCLLCDEREEVLAHESDGPATTESAEICKHCGYEISPKLHMLSGKKILIIGNSHTFYGGTVIEKHQDILDMASRDYDEGYFYQLCQSAGATDVNVVNWTFGNHTLKDLFSGNCQANRDCGNGTDHFSYLVDNNFDYVIFQNGSTGSDSIQWIDFMMDFFKKGNPDTKFVMLVHARAHNDRASDASKYTWFSDLDELEAKGVAIADWGAIVYDLYSGKVTPTDSNVLPFTKTSFVIAKSNSDGYHPNLLAGYITSLTAYCVITGESAVGQSYAFCGRSSYSSLDVNTYYAKYYKVDVSNFRQIFGSAETMNYLQRLVDRYIAEKAYRNY